MWDRCQPTIVEGGQRDEVHDKPQGSSVLERSTGCNKSLTIQVERMRAFQELIKHMQSISALAMHVPREIPFLYLSIKNVVVNVVLVKENVNILFPVYYVS